VAAQVFRTSLVFSIPGGVLQDIGALNDAGTVVTHLGALAFAVPEPGAITLFSAGSQFALIAVRRKKTTE